MKQGSRRRNIIGLSWFTPGRAVFRASGYDNGKPQRHAQGKASFFVLIRRAHNGRHGCLLCPFDRRRLVSICLLTRFVLIPFVKAFATLLSRLSLAEHGYGVNWASRRHVYCFRPSL